MPHNNTVDCYCHRARPIAACRVRLETGEYDYVFFTANTKHIMSISPAEGLRKNVLFFFYYEVEQTRT